VTDSPIVETVDLTKTYGTVNAVDGLSLSVPRGSICGLLGRNGAGKTTTLKVLLGMARPTSGSARVFGLDAGDSVQSVEIRRRCAFVSEEKDLYDSMSVGEIMRFAAAFYPHWRTDLEAQYRTTFALEPQASIKHLSRGARTKLALLLALCSGTELLLLDEPTSGLDPAANEEALRLLVAHASREGTTVLLSSHQLADTEQIADHVAIIDRGRAVLQGALDDIRARYCRVQLVFDAAVPEAALRAPGIVRMKRDGRVLRVLSSAGSEQIVTEARAMNPIAVDVTPVTLKDIFLETVAVEN
jgi:ABC-2 type transport system ATP-binding protein